MSTWTLLIEESGYDAQQTPKEHVGTSATVLVSAHTLCINYRTKGFSWFVSPSEVIRYCVLCLCTDRGKKRRNIQQRAVKLHDHSSLSLRLLSNKSNRTCPSSCLVPVRLWEEDNNRMWKFYKSSSKAFTVNWFRWNPVVLRFHNCLQTDLQPFLTCPERGVLAEKLGEGVRPASQKPSPYLLPESAIFPTLFMIWTLHQNPVSDLCYNWIPSSD